MNERELLASPSTSFWLKGALRTSLDRDCLDALRDAELLVEVLRERNARITDKWLREIGVSR